VSAASTTATSGGTPLEDEILATYKVSVLKLYRQTDDGIESCF
jgi:hypothetical protein